MENNLQERIERIAELRPIDDTFFEVLADDIAFCQEILRVILQDEELIVESVVVQKDMKNLIGRSVRLDAICYLGDGSRVNIEVQRANNDNHFKRIRYNASCITTSETEQGKRFENIPDVIIIYLSEFDILERNRTIYHIDSVVRETGQVIDDGVRIVCANTKIDDGSEIAELMQLFKEKEVNNPKFPAFTRRVNYIKHSEGGRKVMCKVIEEYAEEYAKDAVIRTTIDTAIECGLEKDKIVELICRKLDFTQEEAEAAYQKFLAEK